MSRGRVACFLVVCICKSLLCFTLPGRLFRTYVRPKHCFWYCYNGLKILIFHVTHPVLKIKSKSQVLPE
uniref:Putative secreted peptide n=1 Tax=Anopheles braziliensis TaxID=58242 RepID=A0A2M3ZS05_9DIPT